MKCTKEQIVYQAELGNKDVDFASGIPEAAWFLENHTFAVGYYTE